MNKYYVEILIQVEADDPDSARSIGQNIVDSSEEDFFVCGISAEEVG